MALQHLVESYIPKLGDAFKVERRPITESDISKLSTERLSESTKRYLEKNSVVTLEGKNVWKLPISRYDNENANGRVYEKRLWDRVIQEQTDAYQGNTGLADHPLSESDGEFKNAAVVWLNIGLDESTKTVWGEGIFVGDNGRLAEEVMEAGGRVGFSSSGFGELDESRAKYVRWDTYQLERPADIVLNPSQKVFGKAGMKVTKESVDPLNEVKSKPWAFEPKEDEEIKDTSKNEVKSKPWAFEPKEDEEIKDTSKKEKVCEYCHKSYPCDCIKKDKDDKKQETVMSIKLDKYSVRKFNEDFDRYFNSALAEKDLTKRLSELEDILSYFDETSEDPRITKIKEAIDQTNEAIDKAIREHTKFAEDFGISDTEVLKESVKTLAQNTEYYERTADEWRKIAEGLQDKVQKLLAILETRPTVEAYKVATSFSENLKKTFLKKEAMLLSKISQLEGNVAKHMSIEEKLVTDLKAHDATINGLNTKIGKYAEYTKGLKAKISEFAQDKANEAVKIQEKADRASRINIQPSGHMKTRFEGFNESSDVSEYYADLVARHGTDISPYEEDIKSCKTLREAMMVYTKALSRLGVSSTFKVTEALEPEERKSLIESQTNSRIRTKRNALNLPLGWE
jgi:hypothetical protein